MIGVLSWLIVAAVAVAQAKKETASKETTRAAEQTAFLANEQNTIDVVERWATRVVNVGNVQVQRDFFFDASEVPAGVGTGFIWDNLGHVVTNFHVVDGAAKLQVTLRNGKIVPGQLVGAEPRKDIAVVKVALPKDFNLGPIALANSSELRVGQKAIAIGSPFGLDHSVTEGIVSALGRAMPGYANVTIRDMVQTDAPINPGNSGGPLLDSRGSLMGMNTAIFSKSGSSAGIGFAVPSNTIARIVNQIIKFGRVRQPGLGISTLSDGVAARLGIEGVIIMDVVDGGPADKAGMRGTARTANGELILGDVITKIGDTRIRSFDDLYNTLDEQKIGDIVEVTFRRGGKAQRAKMQLIDLERVR
jgi:S1-C subfamily serine protease